LKGWLGWKLLAPDGLRMRAFHLSKKQVYAQNNPLLASNRSHAWEKKRKKSDCDVQRRNLKINKNILIILTKFKSCLVL
jgi:hypothetical protein